MVTTFSAITEAFVALFVAEPAISSNIYRARDRAVPKGAITALSVQWDGAVPKPGVIKGAPIGWDSRFTIECYARTTAGSPDEAVDPLLLQVYARIAADSTLGGLVDNVGEPLLEAEYSAEGDRTGWIRMTYVVEHETENSTLGRA